MTTCIRKPNSVWTTCTCDECRPKTLKARKLRHHGYYRRVPAAKAWGVLEAKLADGWGTPAIASAANLPPMTISRAVADFRHGGYQTQFHPYTAAAIVNMGRPQTGSVGVHGSRLRLQSLARIGWGTWTLAGEFGIDQSTLCRIRGKATQRRVYAEHANTIADTYERMQHTHGPDPQARTYATRQGWPGPYNWDPEDFVTPVPQCLHGHRMLIEPDFYRPPSHPHRTECRQCRTERKKAA